MNKIVYDGGPKKYVAASSRFPNSKSHSLKKAGQFALIGDISNRYYDTLGKLIDYDSSTVFDMEPFSALATMLLDSEFTAWKAALKCPIGGTPQLFKIYPYLKTLEIAVRWPNAESGKLFLNGREIFDFEKILVPEIDAETLDMFFPLGELDPAGVSRWAPEEAIPVAP
ncbi:hypothetical protein D1610_07145 [Sphingomonas gilva]|uniref:Uncharacterized protein n=1 Tax=Sphingomonas gilva TaxID=2305907 RepID=A0A396RNZ6_9SPHN|nr:hypothetical protein [Sphingomonas gilva]RHW18244.1 hypothetical protein D1610_07145 [Sphingomonas gilva]